MRQFFCLIWVVFCIVPELRLYHREAYETALIIMALHGYAQISTSDQNLTLQIQILRATCCEIIYSEKASGSSQTGRSELQLLLEFLRPGGALMRTRVDRLARSIQDLQDIVYVLNQQVQRSGQQNSQWTRVRQQVKLFSICWAFSLNLKPTSAGSTR